MKGRCRTALTLLGVLAVALAPQKTPDEAKVPLHLIVNLAMGGGWPIDQAIIPSYMYVKHVRA